MFSEIEIKRIEKSIQDLMSSRRPTQKLRNKLDLNFKIEKHSVEIYSIRPQWNDPSKIIESSVAKATYVRKQKIWKIYWQRADLKWHTYEPNPTVFQIQDFIEIIDKDEFGCFWG